ncbi:MAG: hypothetical protein C0490_13335, partial [Marivirga sp.]|nr:hypothetical protein [Marivirga sp.]
MGTNKETSGREFEFHTSLSVLKDMKTILTFLLVSILIKPNAFAQDPWKNVYRESAWKERDTWQRADEI